MHGTTCIINSEFPKSEKKGGDESVQCQDKHIKTLLRISKQRLYHYKADVSVVVLVKMAGK